MNPFAVSFQEEDGSKDIPMVYKRGSVIPFTARLRNGRNPSLSSLGQSFASFAQSYPLQLVISLIIVSEIKAFEILERMQKYQ